MNRQQLIQHIETLSTKRQPLLDESRVLNQMLDKSCGILRHVVSADDLRPMTEQDLRIGQIVFERFEHVNQPRMNVLIIDELITEGTQIMYFGANHHLYQLNNKYVLRDNPNQQTEG